MTLEKAVSVRWYGQMAMWFEKQKEVRKVETVGANYFKNLIHGKNKNNMVINKGKM